MAPKIEQPQPSMVAIRDHEPLRAGDQPVRSQELYKMNSSGLISWAGIKEAAPKGPSLHWGLNIKSFACRTHEARVTSHPDPMHMPV